MVSEAEVRKLALSFPEAIEKLQVDITSFRVKKKLFATMNVSEKRYVVKLTAVQQSVFGAWDKTACYPVPNKFGLNGWTIVEFEKVTIDFTKDILMQAYSNVVPKQLVLLI